jgi:outer membrane protein OmpA-like peptidoglycan-associated protein
MIAARQGRFSMWRVKARAFAVLLTALTAAAPALAEGPPIGQIKTVSGTATLVRGDKHLPARPRDPVYQSDTIETGVDGSIGITFIDNSVFSTGPATELALREFRFDTGSARGNMLAELRKGTLTVVTGDITHTTPGAMTIKTPTAILGVRGTTFAVEVTAVGLCQCINDRSARHLRCLPNAGACEAACAAPQYSFVPLSRGMAATCPAEEQYPQELYVVLPNADGRPGSGAISVSHGATTTTLDQPYAASELRSGEAASLAMDQAKAQVIFKQALAAQPALPRHFRLDFALGRTELIPNSAAAYRSVVEEIKKRPAYEVEVIGHTDTLADDAYNQKLSRDRAVSIRSALVRDGVNPAAIAISWRGELDPLVRTGKGVAELRNRRVEITVR